MRMKEAFLFGFNFSKIKAFLPRLFRPEERIKYLNYVIRKYSGKKPISYDLLTIFRIEKRYWQDVNELIASARKPEYSKNNKDDFIDKLVSSSVFKFDFKERDLFNFNLKKIMGHAEQLSDINCKIYKRWVLKEAVFRLLNIQIRILGLTHPVSAEAMDFLIGNLNGILKDE